jgi:hypothetical protein
VKDPHAVGEPGMRGSGKHEIGESQLPDAPQPLEALALEQSPDKALKGLIRKFDEVVDRIS